MSIVLAVDGGNFKTDLALVDGTGELLSLVRGARSSPHHIGVQGCVDVLDGLRRQALAEIADGRELPARAEIMVAGADLPEELAALHEAIARLGWARELSVENDTFALLRSGTDRGWGVAVVCGGGINCVGVAPDGRTVRFPALGPITGDWGGGYDVGIAALSAGARSADGRGPRTRLETAVPAYFGFADPFELARAIHLRELVVERISELPRVVFATAADDPVAAAIVERLTDEVATFASAALRRLGLTEADTDVVLGGGLIRGAPTGAVGRIAARVHEVAPRANVRVAAAAPIVGAALLGLDGIGADAETVARARAELSAAFATVEGDGARYVEGDGAGAGPVAPSVQAAMRSLHG